MAGVSHTDRASFAASTVIVSKPDRFTKSEQAQTGRANRALKRGKAGYMVAFLLALDAYLFTLAVSKIAPGLDDRAEAINDPETVEAIFRVLEKMFLGVFFAVIEVGKNGRLHVHVIAHRDDGPPDMRRNTRRCKWVYDFHGLYRYLHKNVPGGEDARIDYKASLVLSDLSRAPRVRRHFLSAKRREQVDYGLRKYPYDLTLVSDLLPCGRCRERCLCKPNQKPLIRRPPPPPKVAKQSDLNRAKRLVECRSLKLEAVLGLRSSRPGKLD